MRIFSNFDTRLRQRIYEEYQTNYGIDNVLCFWRSTLYLYYRILIPLTLLVVATVLWLMFFYQRLDGTYFNYIITVFVIIDIVFMFPIIGKYVDYIMDFIVVIPSSIMMYDQWGILKRNIHTISALSIKAISISKSWLLYSLFDNWDILILTEGDTEHDGEIRFRWIPDPEKKKNQIVKIVGIDLKANQNPMI
jgi:hypothetical protein